MTTPQLFVLICLIDYGQRKPVAEYSDLTGTTATSSRMLGGRRQFGPVCRTVFLRKLYGVRAAA
jgi:hypothetical protein